MQSLSVLFFLVFSSNVYAASNKLKIVQVIKSQHILVAQGKDDGSINKGQTFLVNFPDDQQCSVVLKDIENQNFTFDTSSCDLEPHLKKNLELEPSMVPIAAEPPAKKAEPAVAAEPLYTKIRFGLSAHYNFADSVDFDDTIGNDVTMHSKGAVGVGVRGMVLEENSWGVIGGLHYEMKRKIDSYSGGGTIITFTQQPEISYFFLEGAGAYRWGFFYIPFGLNLSIPVISKADGEKFTGTIGAMLGAGFMVHEHASFEFLIRSIGARFKDDSTDNIMGTGFLTGVALTGNYWF